MLTDAGVEVFCMMGNHDRRANFLEVHPERAGNVREWCLDWSEKKDETDNLSKQDVKRQRVV